MDGIYRTNDNQFTDKNGNVWCAVKGKICSYATVSGQCSMSACREALPDFFIVNGVKYVSEKSGN